MADINIEEYVPTINPTNKINVNSFNELPPKINNIKTINIVLNEVIVVLVNVLVIELLIFDVKSTFSLFLNDSLILSKIITVLFTEYPISVSIEAINV